MTSQRVDGPAKPPRKHRKWWQIALRLAAWSMLLGSVAGLGVAGYAAKYVRDQYRKVEHINIGDLQWDLSTMIYDRDGQPLKKLFAGEDRTFAKLAQVPKHVQQAVIAIEDARFYSHKGVDPYRIGGAAVATAKYMLTKQGGLQGASTITQQLARNAYLTQDQNVDRKVQEMVLAVRMERLMTKDEILEKYVNEIFMGHRVFGIGAAAKFYFGKPVENLTLAEGAMLAGLIQQPNNLSPYVDEPAAESRMRIVLDQMVRYGFLAPAQAAEAKQQKLVYTQSAAGPTSGGETDAGKDPKPPLERSATHKERFDYSGAHYADHVINALTNKELADFYGLPVLDEMELFRGGYKIYTAMNPHLQLNAEEGITRAMDPKFAAQKGVPGASKLAWSADDPEKNIQGAAVMMDPKTGDVLAMTGGRSHQQERELNRATGIYRQPGSTIKPLAVYTPAFEYLGLSPGSVIDDVPFSYDPGTDKMWPQNFELDYYGLMPIRTALEMSRNGVAISLLNQVGPKRGFQMAQNMGLRNLVPASYQPNDVNLALGLGGITKGVTVLEMAQAYSTLANLGERVTPVVIHKIEDRAGNVIYQANPERKRVVSQAASWLMVDTMKGVFTRYGNVRRYSESHFSGWPVAGKTGTTESNIDAWFIGYTPNVVTAVWNGYDNRTKAQYLPYTGAWMPVIVWNEIMQASVGKAPAEWSRPAGINQVEICTKTGLLPSDNCPEKKPEWFIAGKEPRDKDDLFWKKATVIQEKVLDETGKPKLVDGKESLVWRLWSAECGGAPVDKVFLVRPDFPRHPGQANNPLWLPRDVVETAPAQKCTSKPPDKPQTDNPPTQGPGNTPQSPADGGQANPNAGSGSPPPGPGAAPGSGTAPGTGAAPPPGSTAGTGN